MSLHKNHGVAPLFVLLLVFSVGSYAQESKTQTPASLPLFMNVNVGFGMPYGGLGGNFELGAGHLSSFVAFGYAPKRIIDTIVIDPTFNYMLGLRYYFDIGSNFIYPRAAVTFGWVTNYYNERIGNETYRQKVEGLSVQVGTQIISAEGFIVNLDLVMSSTHIIVNQVSHPHFYNFYIRPSIGIGYELQRLGKKKDKKRTIKNDRIDPLG